MGDIQISTPDHGFLLLQFFQIRVEGPIELLPIGETNEFSSTVGNVGNDQIESLVFGRDHSTFVVVFSKANAEFHFDGINLRQQTNPGVARWNRKNVGTGRWEEILP